MLKQRVLSALVMAPVALAAAWVGDPAFSLLAAVASGLMVWEWRRMSNAGAFDMAGALVAATLAAAVAAFPLLPFISFAVVVALAPTAGMVGQSRWMFWGVLYIGLPVLALVVLREHGGIYTLLWLFAVVWGTDIGAYAVGRTLGGPKLAPRISPGKTWSGLLGGMITAALLATWGGTLAHQHAPWFSGVLGFLLAAVAQVGDLFESWVKRRWGVKDSSRLIPGHGGILDRVDGLIAVAPFVALLVWVYHGGLEVWP